MMMMWRIVATLSLAIEVEGPCVWVCEQDDGSGAILQSSLLSSSSSSISSSSSSSSSSISSSSSSSSLMHCNLITPRSYHQVHGRQDIILCIYEPPTYIHAHHSLWFEKTWMMIESLFLELDSSSSLEQH